MSPESETPASAVTGKASITNKAVPTTVTPLTVAGFLIGRRAAIEAIYECPKILWVGALLVLSAGFAREYDGEDLSSEPWHLLIPHAASLATSILLYAMLRIPAAIMHEGPAFRQVVRDFPKFLGLYWLTAPLAWLYAIPFEYWQEAGEATRTNLTLLLIVSVWRVALIIRAAVIVYKPESFWGVLITVLLFGNAVMLAAIRFVPVPIFQLMGGIRLTESESVVQATAFFLQLAGYPMLLVLFAIYLFLFPPTHFDPSKSQRRSVSISLTTWLLATLSVMAWAFVLPITQPAQQLRHQVETAMDRGDLQTALDVMQKHKQDAFPPHWSPPPYIAFSNQAVDLTEVMQVILNDKQDSWVKQVYLEKFCRKLPGVIGWQNNPETPQAFAFLRILSQLPVESWRHIEEWETNAVVDMIRGMARDDAFEFPEAVREDLDAIIKLLNASTPDDSDESATPDDDMALDSADDN